ncbi:DNA-binding response regulator [Duganella rhizosphaerae]|uniref:winged helix-turn-helix domain-containing protein n=1 Tax=Duganella rhizosphaerae TaxID=2885763 RepID=UPI0030EAF945
MRCLVIEDEADTSNYICKGLREAGYLVSACDNGPDGLDLAAGNDWDIIILDRMLPGRIDGLSIVDKLRALGKQTPVIIVSALTSIDARVTGLRGGADDYLSKPFAFSELLARVEALQRRSAPGADSSQLQVADLKLDLRTLRVTRGAKVITLQPREYRLLEYLMRNVNQVVTRTMLLESVWDYHFDPQTNVIDVQISRLRAKVDKDFPVMLIHTLRGVGYRMGAAPPEDTEPPAGGRPA